MIVDEVDAFEEQVASLEATMSEAGAMTQAFTSEIAKVQSAMAATSRDAEVLSPYVGIGALLYALSALAWFYAMRHITLTQGAVLYTVFSLLVLCVIAALVFDERLGPREFTGIAAAVVAVILLANVG